MSTPGQFCGDLRQHGPHEWLLSNALRTLRSHCHGTQPAKTDPAVPAVLAVIAAWTNPGPNPWYHDQAKAKLRSEWPTLARALDDLTH